MDRAFSDLVGLFKSWVTCRSEPAHLSRDFWMPDQSCRVCYECDSQFTLVNRRHHCRICGRIFCGKCTSNWVSSPSSEQRSQLEECDKFRACNYCFEQWRQGLERPAENGEHVGSLDLSSCSPSVRSYISTKSSGTCDSSSKTCVSLQHAAGPLLHESPVIEMDSQSIRETMTTDTDTDIADQNLFQNHIRSDDDEEEIGVSDLDCRMGHFPPFNGYYSQAHFEDMNNYKSRKVYPDGDGDAVGPQSMIRSTLLDTLDSQDSAEVKQVVQKDIEHDVPDEYEEHSSVYGANVDAETFDFENNGILWLPPEPENEEDERETFLLEDDEEGEAAGEWGYLTKSSSFESREYRSRDKSNEEHKRAMKNVVDGHFRALVAQLLQVENLTAGDENDNESWLEIITALSWEAATLLKPDMSTGGQMDPGGYVKVKCLASGHRRESMVIRGVVCKKNVAHRRMTSKIDKPRLIILGGALEYQRVSNALSSFDTLLQQEMDHLKMAVAKIDSHHPNVLLVEKAVSRPAQEYLLEKDISLVLNVKRPLLERIARCTGGQIVPSVDHLSSQKLGYCDIFHVEKFLEEHDTGHSGKQPVKTLMYFEGCPKPLGCTILLRGANTKELKKVKHVLHYGVFAAYHLGLETSFLADEGASLPEFPFNSTITVALPDKLSNIGRSTSIHAFTVQDTEKTSGLQSADRIQSSNSVPSELEKLTVCTSDGDECSEMSTFPACMIPKFTESLASSFEEGLRYPCINKQPHHHAIEEGHHLDFAMSPDAGTSQADISVQTGNLHLSADLRNTNGQCMQSECCDFDDNINIPNPPSLLNGVEILEKHTAPREEFPPSPSDQQSILVSLSSRCIRKGTVCERSHLLRIKYYGNFDKPLGRFLRDHLFDKSYRCRSCDMPSEAHVHCYTHRQGTLTISVKKLQDILLPGERDGKIWMWHRCLRCPRTNGFLPTTRRVVMSDAAWGLSFGKFLELSFSNHAAASRVASCGHSLHRDCLRFYGFGKMVACFRYASIDVYSVHVPPPKLEFIYESQDWIEKHFNEVAAQAELLFSEVLNALRLLVERYTVLNSTKVPESRRYLAELERMLQKGKSEFEEELHKILDKNAKEGEPVIDILQINRLHRDLIWKSYMWDRNLRVAAGMKNEGQPDERQVDCSESIEEVMERPVDVNISEEPGKITDSSDSVDANIPEETGKITDSSDSIAANISDNTGEVINSSDSVDADVNKHLDCFTIDGNGNLHPEMFHQRIDFVSGPGNQNWLAYSSGMKANGESETIESDNVHGSVSDGQPPISLSETLDEAWTGANGLGFGITKKSNKPESVEADNLSTVRLLKRLNGQHEDLVASKEAHSTSSLSSKSSDNMGHLGPSITDIVTSSDKNVASTDLNLDMIIQSDPIYTASFWDPEVQGGARLLLPVGANDIVVPVYDDEPTSLISYALVLPDYLAQISDEPGRPKDYIDSELSMSSFDLGRSQSTQSLDEMMLESNRTKGSLDDSIPSTVFRSTSQLDPVSSTKSLHARVTFGDVGPLGKVTYAVTCYYAKHFEALRRRCCPSVIDFVRSLSRCRKWGAQGGKSNVFFAKTLDDRFIIKQVTKTELESFIKFAPAYFKYLSESLESGSPTCLAKILGIYQVASKHVKGGKESKMDLLVMENLLFRRNLTRLYDLKGSSRSRYNADSSGSNKVLLDQNLIEAMPTSPIFVGNKAKRLLERAIWNDTAFLASVDVMDYSLLVGIDEEKHELVVGIIDFMRQYTWDKHLETWVKASGILGGSKNASPTVISPKQYKKRFRKAMSTYFLVVPDQWSPPTIIPSKSQIDSSEENNTQKDHPGEQQTLA